MSTFATLFSGGELYGVGARNAGLSHLWGIEYDNNIAQVARLNGFNVSTADVLSIDPTTLEAPDLLHASPVCKRASVANQSTELNDDGTKEALEDIDAGIKVAQFIDILKPKFVTIENVYAYRNFRAFKIIRAALDRGGYWWDYDNLNAADFGVPQTRRRLILRASRVGLLPNLPAPVRWVGWYEAIEDLIPELPGSQFAEWQLARLPEKIKFLSVMPCYNNTADDREEFGMRYENKPSFGITSNSTYGKSKAFILNCQKAGDTNGERGVTLPQGNAPVFTVTSGKSDRQPVSAWLVDGKNTGRTMTALEDDSPSFTIQAGAMRRPSSSPRAWLSQGRVVKMTPRALARFQSLPDSYLLPDNNKLACTIIGNGVPCKLAEIIAGALVNE